MVAANGYASVCRPRPGPGILRTGWGKVMRLQFAKPGLSGTVTVTPGLQTLAAAIQTQEGYAPGTLAYQNNNPGNLIYAGQPGATPGAGGFAAFPTYQDGLNALYNQLNLYATGTCGACNGQPLTIAQMTAIYAPAGQGSNDPGVYATNIANATGASVNTPLSDVIAGDDSDDSDGEDDGTDNTNLYIAAGVVGLIGLAIAAR